MGGFRLKTKRGYALLDVASAMQKAIRRSDPKLAGYWALELYCSGFQDYVWKRLFTVSGEDCFGLITHEIKALHYGWSQIDKKKRKEKNAGRIFVSKAVILLSLCPKSRDADHLQNLIFDTDAIPFDQLQKSIEEAQQQPEDIPIPDYAYDVHTSTGRKRGKTKEDFFRDEDAALRPKRPSSGRTRNTRSAACSTT